LALKLVALALYALAGVFVWLVGRRTVGEPGARIGAALFWLWPPFFVWWSTKARAYFASGLIIGLAALLLVLRLRERDSKRDAALLGLVLGIGVWATLQSMLLALPALLWLAYRRPAAFRLAPVAIPGLVLGAFPWLAWNLTHQWNALVPHSVAGAKTDYLDRLWGFFTVVLPSWLGLQVPYSVGSVDWAFGRLVGSILLVIAITSFVFLCVRRPGGLEPLLVVAALFPFIYAASPFTYWLGEPRYLVFFGPFPALLIGWGLVRAGRVFTVVALVLAFSWSVAVLVEMEHQGNYPPGLPEAHGPSDLSAVLDTLERAHVNRVRANYWIAYRITFESKEHIIASPGFWRYKPYRDLVAADPRPGRVFVAGSPEEKGERSRLLCSGYVRQLAGGFAVYVPR
jgi:hypothetical protein